MLWLSPNEFKNTLANSTSVPLKTSKKIGMDGYIAYKYCSINAGFLLTRWESLGSWSETRQGY